MPDDWISKPHIRISREEVRIGKKRSRQPPLKMGPKKEPSQSGKELIQQFEEVVKYHARGTKVLSKEDIFFILHTERPVSYEEGLLDRLGVRFSLQSDENSAVVSLASDATQKFRDMLRSYAEASTLKSYIDNVNSLSLADFDRLSPDLREWLNTAAASEFVADIEMLPNLGEERYSMLKNSIVSFLQEQECELFGSRIREAAASIRAKLKPQTARIIAEGADSIWQIKKAPDISIGKPQRFEIRGLPEPKPPDYEAKTICILDTGVDPVHPYLKSVLVHSADLTGENSPNDIDGHGTFVAGLAAYGDLENRTDPKASAHIISAKILKNGPDNFPNLEGRIEDAVRRFHTEAKIFNLSIMYLEPCDVSRPTEIAYTLDKLSHDYNVLFTVSTGNVEDELSDLVMRKPYPEYFAEKCCRIYCGAEASTTVTVGGVAHKDSDLSIAKKNEPSPFTRRGELDGKVRAKPDIVSWAGNVEHCKNGPTNIRENGDLDIISLALSPGTLAKGIGTSYSAPAVANMLAKLSREYPEADASLLKALLIHFARWPEEHARLRASQDLKKVLYGKGVPDFFRCAYSTESSATYVLEDSVRYDNVAVVPIYVPRKMKNIYGDKIMRVTLVYDPPVDRGVTGYSLVDLDFRLYKQMKLQRNWDNIYRRRWDNVKTDVFRWQKSGWGKEWSILIVPRIRFKNRIPDIENGEQKFALVVTLEDPSKKHNIYDAIINERKKITIKPLTAYPQSVRKLRPYDPELTRA